MKSWLVGLRFSGWLTSGMTNKKSRSLTSLPFKNDEVCKTILQFIYRDLLSFIRMVLCPTPETLVLEERAK